MKQAGLDCFCDFYRRPADAAGDQARAADHVPYTMDINDALIHRQPFEAGEFAR